MNLDDLDRRLGVIIDRGLLTQALTHSSFISGQDKSPSSERLEFLGDSVLGFVVTDVLFRSEPDRTESELSRMRLGVVSTEALDLVGRKLGLLDFLRLQPGLLERIPENNSKVLADAVEAVIGAAYVDQGLSAASYLIERFILPALDMDEDLSLNDAKSLMYERVVALKLGQPAFEVTFEGDFNDRTYFATLTVGDLETKGVERSRKRAEREAAKLMLEKLG